MALLASDFLAVAAVLVVGLGVVSRLLSHPLRPGVRTTGSGRKLVQPGDSVNVLAVDRAEVVLVTAKPVPGEGEV